MWITGRDVTLQAYSKDHIDILVTDGVNGVWRFIGICGPLAQDRKFMWELIDMLINMNRRILNNFHLFLQCDFARSLWFKVFREFGVFLEIPNNFLDLLKGCSNARWTNTIKELVVCVVWTVLWGVWGERNSRTFNNMYTNLFSICGIKFYIG